MTDRFAFGENWRRFSDNVEYRNFLDARVSLQELTPDLKGKTFLDVGCGSGLFSIAAASLGAKKVLGFDLDPQSVATSNALLEQIHQWDSTINEDAIEFRVESILNENLAAGQYDIVYSWGVLHHTGSMYKAFEAIAKLVADKGTLVLAIYNKHFTSPMWKIVKYTYVRSSRFIRKLLVWLVLIVKLPAVLILTRQNPFRKKRGMRYYTDIVDWVGGYPYEYASVDEVTRYFQQHGFKCTRVIRTKGFTGCNEFVFRKET